eukprot:5114556-Amphidinium_carterae.1
MEDMVSLNQLAEQLTTLKVASKGWNKSNFKEHFSTGYQVLADCLVVGARIKTALATLKAVRLLEVRHFSGERRKEALQVRRVVKPLMAAEFWRSALTWFGQTALGINKDAKMVVQDNILKQGEKCAFCAKGFVVPQKWSVDDQAVPAHERKIQPLLLLRDGLDHFTSTLQTRLLTAFQDDGNQKLNMCVVPTNEAQLKPEWVPDLLLDGHRAASGFTTFGRPCLMGGCSLSWRFGPTSWPHPGVGGFVFGKEGTVCILLIPMSKVLLHGGSIEMLTAFLNNMTTSDCTAFMQNNAVYFPLSVGEMCWIPYGFHVSVVTTSEKSVLLWVPWHHRSLMLYPADALEEAVYQWNEGIFKTTETQQDSMLGLMWWRGSKSA